MTARKDGRLFLGERPMTDEQKVVAALPGAKLWGGRHGKVWVSDGNGNMLSDVMYSGTREHRREIAWKQAAEKLGLEAEVSGVTTYTRKWEVARASLIDLGRDLNGLSERGQTLFQVICSETSRSPVYTIIAYKDVPVVG